MKKVGFGNVAAVFAYTATIAVGLSLLQYKAAVPSTLGALRSGNPQTWYMVVGYCGAQYLQCFDEYQECTACQQVYLARITATDPDPPSNQRPADMEQGCGFEYDGVCDTYGNCVIVNEHEIDCNSVSTTVSQ